MIHEWHFSMLELQPVELLVSTPTSRIAALSDLVVREHEAMIVLHRWHFGMLELQPVYLLVTALGSRLAVASKHLTLRLQHVAEDPAT